MKFKDLGRWLEEPIEGVPALGNRRLNAVRGFFARLTTPLIPDDYLHLVNPLWSARELRGRVVNVRPETADSATLVIKPGWGFRFDYKAGQFVGIGLHVDGRWHWRSYSLVSPPSQEEGVISIAVKAMPEGYLSSHLVGGVRAGTIVRLAAPQGDFTLPEPPPEKILFITAGSGITPVISMLRTLTRRGEHPDIAHVHSARRAGEVMFREELAEYERSPHYRVHLQLTAEAGKFSPAQLDDHFPDWREREVWACGPQALLDAVEAHLTAEGRGDHLHVERFTIDRSAHAGQGGTVRFRRSGKSITIDGATTVLEAGEKAGVQMPFGCRMGICHTCVAEIQDGFLRDLRSGREAGPGERVKTCVSSAAGDCSIEL
ncbi:ferredoxin reductase [Hoyosella sp. YIM 151337]|uniref:ferredoxin reductase n=1 Tax=Hoyosella sp. YIM 151337 TaxID=2992742 RepID=UPI0022362A4F|nr:ferredoxin reductase [Hoyosella sp. YIM 151337]MCW4352294.1 ferredoxin reductase [Hoyosella sp. YIM 151337]